MIKLVTSELTIAVNALPMMTPTAKSKTLPRLIKKVEEEVEDAGPEPEIELLSEIRDLLKDKK